MQCWLCRAECGTSPANWYPLTFNTLSLAHYLRVVKVLFILLCQLLKNTSKKPFPNWYLFFSDLQEKNMQWRECKKKKSISTHTLKSINSEDSHCVSFFRSFTFPTPTFRQKRVLTHTSNTPVHSQHCPVDLYVTIGSLGQISRGNQRPDPRHQDCLKVQRHKPHNLTHNLTHTSTGQKALTF